MPTLNHGQSGSNLSREVVRSVTAIWFAVVLIICILLGLYLANAPYPPGADPGFLVFLVSLMTFIAASWTTWRLACREGKYPRQAMAEKEGPQAAPITREDKVVARAKPGVREPAPAPEPDRPSPSLLTLYNYTRGRYEGLREDSDLIASNPEDYVPNTDTAKALLRRYLTALSPLSAIVRVHEDLNRLDREDPL